MSVYRSFEVQAITFYRDDTGETCQFDLIEGSTFSVERTPIQQAVQAGRQITVLEKVTLKVSVFDNGQTAMLESWEANYTAVRAVAAGNPNLQWYADGRIILTRTHQVADGLVKYDIELSAVEVPGQREIHMNENLLAYLGWKDDDNDGLADGCSAFGLLPQSRGFANGIQTVLTPDNTPSRGIQMLIVFPINPIKIIASIYLNNNGTGAAKVSVIYKPWMGSDDFGGSSLESPNRIYTSSRTTPSSPKMFFAGIILAFNNSNHVAWGRDVSNPCLTTNGKLTPGDRFMDW